MSVTKYLPNYEDSFQFYNIAKDLIDENNFQQALLFLEKASQKDPPYSVIYFLKSRCHFFLHNFTEALKSVNEALDIINTNQINETLNDVIKAKLLYQRSKIFRHLNNNQARKEDLEQIRSILRQKEQRNNSKSSFEEVIKELDKRIKRISDRKTSSLANVNYYVPKIYRFCRLKRI